MANKMGLKLERDLWALIVREDGFTYLGTNYEATLNMERTKFKLTITLENGEQLHQYYDTQSELLQKCDLAMQAAGEVYFNAKIKVGAM